MIFSFSIRSNMYIVTCFLLACSGKTALAATIGIESGFPFIKIVSPTLSMLMLHCWGLGYSLSWFFQPWLGLYLFHVRFVCVLGLIKQEKTFLLCAVAFWILVFYTGVWLGTCLWLWRCLISSAAISYVCPMLYTHKSSGNIFDKLFVFIFVQALLSVLCPEQHNALNAFQWTLQRTPESLRTLHQPIHPRIILVPPSHQVVQEKHRQFPTSIGGADLKNCRKY